MGQQAHSALGKCQGLSTILFLSQCARLPPAFLSLCSSPSFPAGLWDCSQHPQLLASARTRACPGYAHTDQAQLADVPGGPAFDQKPPLHPHPYTCMLILTPTSSSSPLHTRLYARTLTLTTASSSSPLHPHPHLRLPHAGPQSSHIAHWHPWHCPDHAGLVLAPTLPKHPLWLSPAPRAGPQMLLQTVRLKPRDPSGGGRMRLRALVGGPHRATQGHQEPCGTGQ